MLSLDHYQTYLTARKTLALTLFLALLLAHTSTAKRLRWLVRVVVATGLLSAVFGILRQFVQTEDATGFFVLPFLFYGTGYGQFISPNAFAYLMEMTLGILLGVLLGGGTNKKQALIYISASVIVFTALVLCNSRGGLVALVCELMFLVFMALSWYSQRSVLSEKAVNKVMGLVGASKLIRLALVAVMLVVVSVSVVWIGGDNLLNKVAGQTAVDPAASGLMRQEIWRASGRLFKAYPWTGAGFGAFPFGITQFEQSSGLLKLEQAHNDYLDLAASGGIIGLCLGAWFVAILFWQVKKSFAGRHGFQRTAALGAVAGILATSIHSLVDFGLQLTGIAVVFVSLITILAADVPAEAGKGRRRRRHSSHRDAPNGFRSGLRPVSPSTVAASDADSVRHG